MIVASGRRAWQKSITRRVHPSRVTTAGDARHVLALAPRYGVTTSDRHRPNVTVTQVTSHAG